MRNDTHAPEVESVSVPACHDRRTSRNKSRAVLHTRDYEVLHFLVVEDKVLAA